MKMICSFPCHLCLQIIQINTISDKSPDTVDLGGITKAEHPWESWYISHLHKISLKHLTWESKTAKKTSRLLYFDGISNTRYIQPSRNPSLPRRRAAERSSQSSQLIDQMQGKAFLPLLNAGHSRPSSTAQTWSLDIIHHLFL